MRDTPLAPNQIYVHTPVVGKIQTLIDGSTDWSYYEYTFSTNWHYRSVFVFYKGRYVCHLLQQKHCLVEYDNHKVKYRNLAHVVETYRACSALLAFIERKNRNDGLEETWCERGTPLATLSIMFPQHEKDDLERLARNQGKSLEEIALTLLHLWAQSHRTDKEGK